MISNQMHNLSNQRITKELIKFSSNILHSYAARSSLILRNSHTNKKRTHPSADRNSQPIAEALSKQLDKETQGLKLLEIASGSGQHAGYLAPLFPNIIIQPTEYEIAHFSSISAYGADCATKNILPPLYVDISKDVEDATLKPGTFDYMLNCNMMHIAPWKCAVGLFRAAQRMLKLNGKMFTYGPYAVDGVLTPESNINFDRSLRSQDPSWGVRDIDDLKKLATDNGIELIEMIEMPSNNKLLVWQKTSTVQ